MHMNDRRMISSRRKGNLVFIAYCKRKNNMFVLSDEFSLRKENQLSIPAYYFSMPVTVFSFQLHFIHFFSFLGNIIIL